MSSQVAVRAPLAGGSTERAESAPESMGRLQAGVGVALLTVYVLAVAVAARVISGSTEEWSRAITLVGGLESLAFIAGGWFFGKEASRKSIDNLGKDLGAAKRENEDAKGRQYTAESDAIKLASMALIQVPSSPTATHGEAPGFAPDASGRGAVSEEWAPGDDLRSLAESVLAKYGVK